MTEQVCATCKFYTTLGKDKCCARFPPQIISQQYAAGMDGSATNVRIGPVSSFPVVAPDWFCGEWKDLQESKWDEWAERTYPNHPF